MKKLNINVTLCGDYRIIEEYLNTNDIFNKYDDENTLNILIGTKQEIENNSEYKNIVCLTTKEVDMPHMICVDLEKQSINALEFLSYLYKSAFIKISEAQIVTMLLNTKEFYFYRESTKSVLEATKNCINSLYNFEVNEISDVVYFFDSNVSLSIDDVQKSIKLLNGNVFKNEKFKSILERNTNIDELQFYDLPISMGFYYNRVLDGITTNLLLIKSK